MKAMITFYSAACGGSPLLQSGLTFFWYSAHKILWMKSCPEARLFYLWLDCSIPEGGAFAVGLVQH
jgi:hypothetical protein